MNTKRQEAIPSERPLVRYVWAPEAETMSLNTKTTTIFLESHAGWWFGPDVLSGGDTYSFTINGKHTLPDPRSHHQPRGVKGKSAVVDHSIFPWTDDSWRGLSWEEAIVYEVHVGTFTQEGTFDAAADRLPHLSSLGVTHIELLPVGQFPGDRGWGYDVAFPFAVQNSYGGPMGLKRFINACHSRGLAVILDVVYNHLGPSGSVLPKYGPYLSETYMTPWGPCLNFDEAGSYEVRRYVCDNALMWLRDYHLDGLRIDSSHETNDTSAVHIIEQLISEIRDLEILLGKTFPIIAEDGKNNPRYSAPLAKGGWGFDAQWANDLGWALSSHLTGRRGGLLKDYMRWDQFERALAGPFVYEGQYSEHRKLHFGRAVDREAFSRFIVYAQNHDLTGNWPNGERIAQLGGADSLKLASALTILSPYIPLLFQGEEWNATSPFKFFAACQRDSALAAGVKKGREMAAESLGWDIEEAADACAPETFEDSKLDWEEPTRAPHSEILTWYRTLISLRKQLLATKTWDTNSIVWSDRDLRIVILNRGFLVIACNLGRRGYILTEDQVGGRCPYCNPSAGEPGTSILASFHLIRWRYLAPSNGNRQWILRNPPSRSLSMTVLGFHASHELFAPGALLAGLKRAEAAGFKAASCSDHFHPWSVRQGESGFAWSWLGSALEASAMTLGVVTAPGQRYHPAILAQAAATLSEMYPDRFWLAAGSGENLNEHITGAPWPPKHIRNQRLFESVKVMKDLWSGAIVDHAGTFTLQKARLFTLPPRAPLVMGAALTPETARWLGSWADGLITAGAKADEVHGTIEAFREGGGERKPVLLQVAISFAETYDQALHNGHTYWRNAGLEPGDLADIDMPEEFDEKTRGVSPADIADRLGVTADYRQIIDWLHEYIHLGVDAIYINHVGPNLAQFIDTCGEHVLPHFAA